MLLDWVILAGQVSIINCDSHDQLSIINDQCKCSNALSTQSLLLVMNEFSLKKFLEFTLKYLNYVAIQPIRQQTNLIVLDSGLRTNGEKWRQMASMHWELDTRIHVKCSPGKSSRPHRNNYDDHFKRPWLRKFQWLSISSKAMCKKW